MSDEPKLEYLSPDDLKPYGLNARVHDKKQLSVLRESIDRFGFLNPILVNRDLVVIAGHGRLMAAKKAGMKRVPVIRLDDLNAAQEKSLRIQDNSLADESSWDVDKFARELDSLVALGPEFAGFLDDLSLPKFIDRFDDPTYVSVVREGGEQSQERQDAGEPSGRATDHPPKKQQGKDAPEKPHGEGVPEKIRDDFPHPDRPPVLCRPLADRSGERFLLDQDMAAQGLTEDERRFLSVSAARFIRINFTRVRALYEAGDEHDRSMLKKAALVPPDSIEEAEALGVSELNVSGGDHV